MTKRIRASLSAVLVSLVAPAAFAQDRASYTEMMDVISKAEAETQRASMDLERRYSERKEAWRVITGLILQQARQASENCDPEGYDAALADYKKRASSELRGLERQEQRNEAKLASLTTRHETLKPSRDRLWTRIEDLRKERDDTVLGPFTSLQDQIDALLDTYYPMNAEYFVAYEEWRRFYWETDFDRLYRRVVDSHQRWPERPKHDATGRCDFVRPSEREKAEEEVRAACKDIPYEAVYGLGGGSIALGGDWRRASEAARPPFDAFKRVMREKRDGATYTFGQINGFYKQSAYTALLGAQKCTMAVIRNAKYFDADEVRRANEQGCKIRKMLAEILVEKAAAQQHAWRKALVELQEMDPCAKVR